MTRNAIQCNTLSSAVVFSNMGVLLKLCGMTEASVSRRPGEWEVVVVVIAWQGPLDPITMASVHLSGRTTEFVPTPL